MKKHLLETITDDLERSKRKIYRVTSRFKKMLNSFKPKGQGSFLPGYVNRKGYYDLVCNDLLERLAYIH